MIKPTEDTELRNIIEREIRCGATIKQGTPQSGYFERADSIIKKLDDMGYRKQEFIKNHYWSYYNTWNKIW